jgi:hypothetical protein
MTEHSEHQGENLDWHLNHPCSGNGRNEPSRIQDLEVERGHEKDADDAAAKEG